MNSESVKFSPASPGLHQKFGPIPGLPGPGLPRGTEETMVQAIKQGSEVANSLRTLSSTNTFFIPEVVTYNRFEDTYYLIIAFVESSHPKNDFWQLFGQKLSELHRNTKDTFGLEYNNYIGSLSQNNTLNSDGIDFFINSRILPQ